MLWFGLYRIYPVKDFMNLLIINFVGELLLQALPISLLTLQANTLSQNDNDDGTLSSLQKGTLGLNVLCLIEIIGQFIVLMKENCQLEEMKNSTRAGEI
jgi:GR25 family glycosyltransferase involved in LPS biosynthesis